MGKEYGGFIEFEYFHGREYHENAVSLNSGRFCVEYLIRAKKIKKIWLPYFMCSSVRNLCVRMGVETEFYHIDKRFFPTVRRKFSEREFLYIVNFYGQLSDDDILEMKAQYGNIIIDNAQAFFCKPLDGIDTAYTCRKFFGVADGAYLYTDVRLNEELEYDLSYNRMDFLFGRQEKTANEFYPQYVANNEIFANESLKRMSRATQNIMRGIDYDFVKCCRTENFMYLYKKFGTLNKLKLIVPEGAFMYPLYIENGAAVRKELQSRQIYVPILWPDVFEICTEDETEYDMAKNILPLPVDQRYTVQDMEYIAREVEKCIG